MDAAPNVNILSRVSEIMKEGERYQDTVHNFITAFYFFTIAQILYQHWDIRLIAIAGIIFGVAGVLIRHFFFFKKIDKTESGAERKISKSKPNWYMKNEDEIRLIVIYVIMYFLLGKMQAPQGNAVAVNIIFALCLIGWIFSSSLLLINPYKSKKRLYEIFLTLPFFFILWKFHLVHRMEIIYILLVVSLYKICVGVYFSKWHKPKST
jgi:hypothetical protein